MKRLVAPVRRIGARAGKPRYGRHPPALPKLCATSSTVLPGPANALADRLPTLRPSARARCQRLARFQEEERQALARDLHDPSAMPGRCGARAAAIELAAPPERDDLREDAQVRSHHRHMKAGESCVEPWPAIELPDLAEADWRALRGSCQIVARTTQVRPALQLDVSGDLSDISETLAASLYPDRCRNC